VSANARDDRRRATLLVAGAGAAFATSGPLSRYAGPVHPLVIVCGRVGLAALALVGFRPRGVLAALRSLAPSQRLGVAAAGLLLAAHFFLFVWGLQRTSLPAAVTLVSLEPLSVVVVAWLLQGIRPAPVEQLGVLLATVGAVVVARGSGSGEHRLEGDLLVVAAVFLYGLYIAAARAFRGALSSDQYASLVYSAAALASALALAALPGAASLPPPHALIAIAGLALIPTLVGHTAVQGAAQILSPSIVALVSPAETLGSLAIGALWLHAIPTSTEVLGAIIIVAGVTTAILGARP
jgi:drug/metabolite transporter (DMT)-like permease